MSDGRVSTIWEYTEGTHKGIRFSSGDVAEWPRCKLVERGIDMDETHRLAVIAETNSLGLMICAELNVFAERCADISVSSEESQ